MVEVCANRMKAVLVDERTIDDLMGPIEEMWQEGDVVKYYNT